MTDLSEAKKLAEYRAANKVRFVTAASLFDGHDASINIMRRILQSMGCEVIHLGHNRSVDEVVNAALQEDVQGIAVSSYQGGHVEYFKYMIDALRARGGEHIQVFGGGGGVIVPTEIRELQDYGVARIYSPEDGQRMGLAGMIGEMVMRCDRDLSGHAPTDLAALSLAAFNSASFGHVEWVDGKVHETGFTTTFTPNANVPYQIGGVTYSVDITSMRDGESVTAPTYAAITARSFHTGVVNALMMDGSTRTVSNSVLLATWQALGTRAGAEPVTD